MKRIAQLVFLLLVAGTGTAQQKSLLWKISGNGLKEPSYLYGTMHTGDSRVIKQADRALSYFNSAHTYAMEIDPGTSTESFDMGLLGKLMMGKDYSLKKMIPQQEYVFLDSVVTNQIGFSMEMFDNVAPVFVMTVFEAMSMGLAEPSGGKDQVLDVYLYDKAKAAGKKVVGIETAEEQLDALSALSYKEQADLLVEEIRAFRENKNDATDVLKYYLSQDLDSLAANEMDAKMPDKFYKALVLDRNKKMADRIPKYIKEHPTFIAIGALHLPGENGVVELLKKKGYIVEAVN